MFSKASPLAPPSHEYNDSSVDLLETGRSGTLGDFVEQELGCKGRCDIRSPETANEYLSLLKERVELIKPDSDNGVFEKSQALVQIKLAEVNVASLWHSLKACAHDSCIIFLTSTTDCTLTRNNRQLRIEMVPNGLVGKVIVDGMHQGEVITLKTFDGVEAKDSGLVVFLRPRRR